MLNQQLNCTLVLSLSAFLSRPTQRLPTRLCVSTEAHGQAEGDWSWHGEGLEAELGRRYAYCIGEPKISENPLSYFGGPALEEGC